MWQVVPWENSKDLRTKTPVGKWWAALSPRSLPSATLPQPTAITTSPFSRLPELEDKEVKDKWYLTTWEDPKWAARKDAERTSALLLAVTPPPAPPNHWGVAQVLAGFSFLTWAWKENSSVQTVQTWCSPSDSLCLQGSYRLGATVLHTALRTCRSVVDGDTCEIKYGEVNDHCFILDERGRGE